MDKVPPTTWAQVDLGYRRPQYYSPPSYERTSESGYWRGMAERYQNEVRQMTERLWMLERRLGEVMDIFTYIERHEPDVLRRAADFNKVDKLFKEATK